jgi:hypothetical protein
VLPSGAQNQQRSPFNGSNSLKRTSGTKVSELFPRKDIPVKDGFKEKIGMLRTQNGTIHPDAEPTLYIKRS